MNYKIHTITDDNINYYIVIIRYYFNTFQSRFSNGLTPLLIIACHTQIRKT